jgi:hypothetical protein
MAYTALPRLLLTFSYNWSRSQIHRDHCDREITASKRLSRDTWKYNLVATVTLTLRTEVKLLFTFIYYVCL